MSTSRPGRSGARRANFNASTLPNPWTYQDGPGAPLRLCVGDDRRRLLVQRAFAPRRCDNVAAVADLETRHDVLQVGSSGQKN